jgi:hypothetical protein
MYAGFLSNVFEPDGRRPNSLATRAQTGCSRSKRGSSKKAAAVHRSH